MTIELGHVRIVGAGLIGTSIALALAQAGVRVSIVDSDERAQDLAQDLLGNPSPEQQVEELLIVATPPAAIADVISQEISRNPALRVMDISSIKSQPVLDVATTTLAPANFAPTHPMAGREVSGPASARADLFIGRPWIFSRDGVDSELAAMVSEVIRICGGVEIERSVGDHDRAVAAVSHLPQLSASLLAKSLLSATDEDLDLAGAGLRDSTRIAGSDPDLWAEIISGNAAEIRPLLISLQNDLSQLIQSLDSPSAIAELLELGRQGRARIPGKHGGSARNYTYIPIVIDDKPGQLAAIFEECAKAQVNIEDLSIEHSPGQETGLITLALSPNDGVKIADHLGRAGWKVHPSR